MIEYGPLLKATLVLFAIVNPISSIPLFMQLTSDMAPTKRRRAFRTGCLAATAILFIFILAGERILTDFFQVTLADLMAAGGLLLLIIAIDHLIFGVFARSVMSQDQQDADHIGAVPIACPILAGPGAMMTVLLTYSEHGFITAALSVAIVMGVSWLVMHFSDVIYKVLGKTICTVLSKILCLFIAAIGVRLLMLGISEYLH